MWNMVGMILALIGATIVFAASCFFLYWVGLEITYRIRFRAVRDAARDAAAQLGFAETDLKGQPVYSGTLDGHKVVLAPHADLRPSAAGPFDLRPQRFTVFQIYVPLPRTLPHSITLNAARGTPCVILSGAVDFDGPMGYGVNGEPREWVQKILADDKFREAFMALRRVGWLPEADEKHVSMRVFLADAQSISEGARALVRAARAFMTAGA